MEVAVGDGRIEVKKFGVRVRCCILSFPFPHEDRLNVEGGERERGS